MLVENNLSELKPIADGLVIYKLQLIWANIDTRNQNIPAAWAIPGQSLITMTS